jgi:hypothetical protein
METFWNEKDGPLDASVIVIDDPQLAALIPFIRKRTPEAKIIYRELRHHFLHSSRAQKLTSPVLMLQDPIFKSTPLSSTIPRLAEEFMLTCGT